MHRAFLFLRGDAPGRARDERGAALVEFVLILPIFVLIVFGGVIPQSVTKS